MKIHQVINNNLVFTQDEQGNEIVAVGRGIGFQSRRGDPIDQSKIEKIFTLQNETEKNRFMLMVQEIPYETISFGIRVCDYIASCSSKQINRKFLLIPLVDHINTTLERYRQDMRLDASVLWSIRFLYREEFKIAQDVVDMMISTFNLPIDDSEACYITLHIINAELDLDSKDGYRVNAIVETAVQTLEECLDMSLNKESVDFSRFVAHLQFFAKRIVTNAFWDDEEDEISKVIRLQYKSAYRYAQTILSRLEEQFDFKASKSEYTYLTIHIARLLKARK